MERRTLWRPNVVATTRARDGRKQSHHRMGSSGSTSGRTVQRTYKQSFVFQYPTSGLTRPSRPTSSLSQRTRPSLKADKLPARAHSSLGFAWSSQSVSKHELSQPQGFDLARYVKRQGSAAEIRIGVNGETTNDDYFRNYLKECEKQLKNASTWSLDDESVSELQGDISEGNSISQNTRKPQKHVPLCWEDQFKKAEHNMIKTAGRAAGKTTARKSSSSTCAKAPQSPTSDSRGEQESWITENLQDLSVMLSWGEMCVLNWTAVKHINTVTVPQATHSEDNSLDNQCEGEATVSDPSTDTSTLPLQLVATEHDGYDVSKQVQLSSLLDIKQKDIINNLLCIWLKPSTAGTSFTADLNYEDLTFDVFVTFTGSSTVAFTKVKCRDISGSVLAIVVNLDGRCVQQDQFVRQLAPCTQQEVKVSVTFHRPRRMLFSTKIMLPVKHTHTISALSPIPSQPDTPLGDKAAAFPEKFFKRRSSYCNPEEDEDRTDIRALVSHYPDLQMLDLNTSTTTPLLLHHELTSSSQDTQETVIAGARPTIQLSPPPTPSPASTNWSLFRPHSKPQPTTGYVAIVKHWLTTHPTNQ